MNIENWINSELGRAIWANKYQQNGETFEEWLNRICGGNEQLKQLILDKKFLFGGRILAYRNLPGTGLTYSNCYVLPQPEDNIESIFETARDLARTFSYGGGVGIDISKLRPKNSPVNNAAKTTSGAVSFMDVFEQVSRVIGQAGRRGALMISMDAEHADVSDFMDAKLDNKLEKCNISIKCSDKFMENAKMENSVENKHMQHLAKNNWDYAEPGILYWDTIKEYNILSEFSDFSYAGVNPCAEEPLPAGGSCLLGSLNLSAFVENPFTDKAAFNIPEFKQAVRIAVRALNQVLDEGLELHPLQIQRDVVRDWRQIGLGIMGFADTVLMLGYQYGDKGSQDLIDLIGKALVNTGLHESSLMAKEMEPFPKCDNSKVVTSNYISILYDFGVISDETLEHIMRYGLRNSQLFTIAPTGSISTMLGVSGGVEPIFATHYTRKTQALHGEDTYYKVYTPIVDVMLNNRIIAESDVEKIVTAQTMNPFHRVEIQGKWQQYIDAAISSTVNLTEDATPELIQELYMKAWEAGCKGLTVYRAGCKKGAVLEVKSEEKQEEPTQQATLTEQDYSIENCQGFGTKLQTGCGSLWVTAYFHKVTGQLCHIFLDKGSCGGCNSFMIGLSRMISLAGKKGATIPEIIDQLNSVPACPSYAVRAKTKKDTSRGTCCPSAIGTALQQLYNEFLASRQPVNNVVQPEQEHEVINPCPDCGCELVMTEGCNSCPGCGYTKCS